MKIGKALTFWLLMAAIVVLLWLYRGPRIPLRETSFVILFGFAIFWAIMMTMTVVRHENRIAKIERGIDLDAPRR